MKKTKPQQPPVDTPWIYDINDYCWINRRKDATLIRKPLLGYYEAQGWSLGRAPGLKIYIRKKTAIKRVPVEQVEEYFHQGWEPDLEFMETGGGL